MAGFDGPIYLAVTPSLRLGTAALVAHGLALGVLLSSLPTGTGPTVLALLVSCNAVRVWRRLARPCDDDIVAVLVTRDAPWRATLADGRIVDVCLAAEPFVSPWLTALSLRSASDGRRRPLVLVADNVAPDAWRRLRVWLRLRPRGSSPDAASV